MSKRFLMIFGLILLIASIGVVFIEAAATPKEDACYNLCRNYPHKDLYEACFYGCMHSPLQ